jgi:hypothetical protein
LAVRKGGVEPLTFFLNEKHEAARGEKEGGGGLPQYAPIDWTAKSQRLNRSLKSVIESIQRSPDPVRDSRYYLVALPQDEVEKLTKQKDHPTGHLSEETDFGAKHSMVFRRIGLDLVDIASNGKAVVHATKERLERLLATTAVLADEGPKQKSRFMTIESFDMVPWNLRVDESWIRELPASGLIDTVVHFQPMLTRAEFDSVIRAIAEIIGGKRQGFSGAGADFSGRQWVRGRLGRSTIEAIAKDFFSVQSIHHPLYSTLNARKGGTVSKSISEPAPQPAPGLLPCVGVVDSGIPEDHLRLRAYRRGSYVDPDSGFSSIGDHGSLVSSRIVYGDLDETGSALSQPGRCSVYDIMVAIADNRLSGNGILVNDQGIVRALEAIVATAPDVRVFNLSFGDSRPVSELAEVERRERLYLTQDLDNFIFARDVLVVISAGNSPPGMVPTTRYPDHIDDGAWALAAWPSGFNTLTCGSAVDRPVPDGLVQNVGWPSPFSRIGPAFPGECEAPIPEFGAHGGNSDDLFRFRPSLGVWGLNAAGQLEDCSGTSFSAPLLSREAALAFAELQKSCAPGTRVYSATVKAYLALTAETYPTTPKVRKLSERTLGYGRGKARRLVQPDPASAVFVWQGLLQGQEDIVRVNVPIPLGWLKTATSPRLRVACAWDTPVNATVRGFWGCRKLSGQLRTSIAGDTVAGTSTHRSHPLWVRDFDLSADKLQTKKISPTVDLWVLELSYSQIADYLASTEFTPLQRVGVAIELLDDAERPLSPQPAVQALPIAQSMVMLSSTAVTVINPIKLRVR